MGREKLPWVEQVFLDNPSGLLARRRARHDRPHPLKGEVTAIAPTDGPLIIEEPGLGIPQFVLDELPERLPLFRPDGVRLPESPAPASRMLVNHVHVRACIN